YWLPDFETYVDLEGRPLALPKNPARASTVLDRDGRQVAALIHDSELVEERELLDAVGAAAGIALENGRLQADLRARVEELKGSRTRVIEAGQKERQRLERNLHDGAQQRLIALSLRLSLLEQRLVEQPDARVEVAEHANSLVVEVHDDGVGGADTERGSGLRGLADRVEALGGRLKVWTPQGGGTRVQAAIPCA